MLYPPPYKQSYAFIHLLYFYNWYLFWYICFGISVFRQVEQSLSDQHRLGGLLRSTTDTLKDRDAQLVIMEAEHNESSSAVLRLQGDLRVSLAEQSKEEHTAKTTLLTAQTLRLERDRVATALLSRDDFAANLCARLHRHAAAAAQRLSDLGEMTRHPPHHTGHYTGLGRTVKGRTDKGRTDNSSADHTTGYSMGGVSGGEGGYGGHRLGEVKGEGNGEGKGEGNGEGNGEGKAQVGSPHPTAAAAVEATEAAEAAAVAKATAWAEAAVAAEEEGDYSGLGWAELQSALSEKVTWVLSSLDSREEEDLRVQLQATTLQLEACQSELTDVLERGKAVRLQYDQERRETIDRTAMEHEAKVERMQQEAHAQYKESSDRGRFLAQELEEVKAHLTRCEQSEKENETRFAVINGEAADARAAVVLLARALLPFMARFRMLAAQKKFLWRRLGQAEECMDELRALEAVVSA